MNKAGVVGIGDMGSGLAKNLLANGFDVTGVDLLDYRMKAFIELGGKPAENVAEVAKASDVVFVMVMTGDEAKDIILGENGLVANLKDGSGIILSATVNAHEAQEIGEGMAGSGIHLIDSPVSGGFPGAQGGTLTLMAAAPDEVMKKFAAPMQAVSGSIHHVGTEPGQGQTVKACLQSLIGAIFTATFEASVLAAKAGVKGQTIMDVFSTSSASSVITNTSLENIIDRKFEKTGSHISTMHKDLVISLELGRQLGVPLHTAASAMQLFHAGKTKYPDGDNWVVTKVIEEIVGAELHR